MATTPNPNRLPTFIKRKKGGVYSFPGSNPVSISRSDLSTLGSNKYYICEKTDGDRALLWLQDTQALFFDRNMNATPPDKYGITIEVDPAYTESLIDGEIAWNWQRGTMSALTSDYPFLDCPQVQYKHFFELKPSQQRIYEQHVLVASRNYCVDGAIITPEKGPVKAGRNWKLFKWKPRLQNTVDLRIDINLNAYVCDSEVSVATVVASNIIVQPGCIYECQWREGVWSIMKKRTDKIEANDSVTYKNTLINIQENIQSQELFGVSFTASDIDEICKLLQPYKSNQLDANTTLELEFRFDKIGQSEYTRVHEALSTCQSWSQIEKTHTLDQIKGTLRSVTDVTLTGCEACIYAKKRIASHQLKSDKTIKCVLSTEEQVRKDMTSSQLCREKRRVSFIFDDNGVIWSYDLSCINPGGKEQHWEVELECKAFSQQHEHKYVVESGLLKCRDLIEMMC